MKSAIFPLFHFSEKNFLRTTPKMQQQQRGLGFCLTHSPTRGRHGGGGRRKIFSI